MKKDLCTKSIALCAMLFSISSYCMDKLVVTLFLTKGIRDTIKPSLSLQDMGRFNSTCKQYRKNRFDLENICACDTVYCSTGICIQLRRLPYDTLTKVLAHYKMTKNEKMFNHVREWNGTMRFTDEKSFGVKYDKHYISTEKIQEQRWNQLWSCREKESELILLTRILSKSSFNIFDVAKKHPKKHVKDTGDTCTMQSLVSQLCSYNRVELLLVSLGGKIEPRAFRHIFNDSNNWDLIGELIVMGAFATEQDDELGRSLNFYIDDFFGPPERRVFPEAWLRK